MKARAENLVFILVRPTYLGNIGSIARVLKNFGFEQLRLVDQPRNYKDSEARRMSAGAFDVLKNAQTYQTLSAALRDVSLSIGTTAGHHRACPPEPLSRLRDEAITSSQCGRVGWVFGDERNGLSKEELRRCHGIVTLPTRADFPSLNVAQAVGVIAYEMFTREVAVCGAKPEPHPVGEVDDELVAALERLLDRLEFTRKYNRQLIVRELRCLYQRMLPTEREHNLLREVIRRVQMYLGERVIPESDQRDPKYPGTV